MSDIITYKMLERVADTIHTKPSHKDIVVVYFSIGDVNYEAQYSGDGLGVYGFGITNPAALFFPDEEAS